MVAVQNASSTDGRTTSQDYVISVLDQILPPVDVDQEIKAKISQNNNAEGTPPGADFVVNITGKKNLTTYPGKQ